MSVYSFYDILHSKSDDRKRITKRKYPLFDACSQLCTDPFWKETFTQMSKGKFPKGYTYNGSRLTCAKNKKTESIDIPNTMNVTEAYQKCYYFFVNTDYMSDEERRQVQASYEYRHQTYASSVETRWENLSKDMQMLALHRFYDDIQAKYQFTKAKREELETKINLARRNGCITQSSIVYSNDNVVGITGLVIDEHGNISVPMESKKKNKYTYLPDEAPRSTGKAVYKPGFVEDE